jgi:DNA-binding SARP family transcriptional activator
MAEVLRIGGPASRHQPVRLSESIVLRGRLVQVLRGRFDRRLTVIEAGAGFGKSTLLSQALHENQIEQLGVDVLLRVTEADQRAAQLLDGLATALGATVAEVTIGRVVDAVWSLAPASVAVILDDVHRLGNSAPAWDLLRQLLEQLPSNGHLVVSGRTAPRLPMARLLSQDDALVLTEADMAFDDHELNEIVSLRSIPPSIAADLPRWPALATLVGAVGHSESIDYVWDEVLRTLPDERRRQLAAVVPFGDIDDDLIRVLGGTISAADLVEGVPLVNSLDGGGFRLHDLWADALAGVLDTDERTSALRAGGEMLLSRGELGRAADAFVLAGDEVGLSEVVLAIARRPTIVADLPEIARVHGLLPASMRRRAGGRYLEALQRFEIGDREAAVAFAHAAQVARAAGETEMELWCLWRVATLTHLDQEGGPTHDDRVNELAERGIPLARAIRAFTDSGLCQRAGDPFGAIEHLEELDGFGREQRNISVAIRYVDLGRPEALNATIADVLASGVSDVYAAQAVWMQGQIDPTAAWPVARELVQRADSIPLATATSLRSVVVAIGVAAGAHDEIVELSDVNVREARAAVRLNELFAHVAAGLVELVTVSEEAAVDTFAGLLERIPLRRWPERGYLYALALIRGLLPGGEVLDDCQFGPSVSVAVEAGAALAALRGGDAGPAAGLPWRTPTLLRVHVPPPLLAELALAAGDVPGAADVLEQLPHLSTWLRRIADRETATPTGERLAQLASDRAQLLPTRPPYDLHIDLLGGLSVRRSDNVAMHDWTRRERVQQLLAFIALRRDVARNDVAAELWPDLSPEKATANLRVNLHHLQQALQPERGGEPPWFLRTTNSRLQLVRDGVIVDTEMVDAAMADAVRAEGAGLPSLALSHYERVAELADDELLPEFESEWVVYERMRLRSIAQAAASRQGELVLARGEPEAAMGIAARAQRLDPLSERAHRLAIRCHLALGSTGAARDAAVLLRSVLLDAGVTPEHETALLLTRFSA